MIMMMIGIFFYYFFSIYFLLIQASGLITNLASFNSYKKKNNEVVESLLELDSLNRRILFGYHDDFKEWLKEKVEDVSKLI